MQSRSATLSIPNITKPTAWIDTYYPLLNTPGERKLEVLNDDGSVFWSANLEERFEEGDPAGEWHDAVGVWHGLSKEGDVQVGLDLAALRVTTHQTMICRAGSYMPSTGVNVISTL